MGKLDRSEGATEEVYWIKDAPTFIQDEKIAALYNAVVNPSGDIRKVTVRSGEEVRKGSEETIDVDGAISLIEGLGVGFRKGDKTTAERTSGTEAEFEIEPITTPHRRLIQLVVYYLAEERDQLFFIEKPSYQSWYEKARIHRTPRPLVFLNLLGADQVDRRNEENDGKQPTIAKTKLVPMAAEFENGKIVTLYDKLDTDTEKTPPYLHDGDDENEREKSRKKYWRWFVNNFDARKAVEVIEETAYENGLIQWIAFRLPVNTHGNTIRLLFSPQGRYDNGEFAYDLVKMAYENGLRIVGTLRAEPDINVLASYRK